jgi:hypothetical protein
MSSMKPTHVHLRLTRQDAQTLLDLVIAVSLDAWKEHRRLSHSLDSGFVEMFTEQGVVVKHTLGNFTGDAAAHADA